MKYETPLLIALTPAITAIQVAVISKLDPSDEDSDGKHGLQTAYGDWE